MAVPYTFGSATSSIPLSQLDSNFATAITLGTTNVYLGNTTTTLNGLTLSNVTISSGNVTITSVTITNANITGTTTLSGLTASTALALDASKNIVSVTNTGTGNNVLAASPSLTGTVTIATLNLTNALGTSYGGTGLTSYTANGVLYASSTSALTTGSALTFDGTRLTSTTGKFGGGAASNSASLMVNNATNTATGIQLFQDGIESWIMGMPANSAALTWSASGSEQMRLTSTGLGIGTSSPSEKLTVAGNIRLNGNRAVIFQQDSGVAAGTLSFRNSSGTQKAAVASYYNVADEGALEFIGPTGSTNMLLNSSGNLGLGVTPSAWGGVTAIEMSAAGGQNYSMVNSWIMRNAYYNGSSFIYKASAASTLYEQTAGKHQWYNAPSGTAGNAITFSQVMTLDASGYLLVGATSSSGVGASRLQVGGSGVTSQLLVKSSGAHTALYVTASDVYQTWASGGFLAFGNAPADGSTFTERARINSSGQFLLGGTNNGPYGANLVQQLSSGTVWSVGPITGNTNKWYVLNGSGTGVYLADGATSWTANSDERLKDIIEPITNAADKVSSLRAVIGKYKTDAEGTRRSFLIAQDVQAVLPEAVSASDPEKLGVQYTDVIPLLVAAIKELKAEFEAYKATHP